MNTKQIIVIRTDIGMEPGKMIAQGAHASMKVFFTRCSVQTSEDPEGKIPDEHWLDVPLTPAMAEWVGGIFTKVVVQVGSEEELMALFNKATLAGLPCALVEDVGKTVFKGVKTRTAIAIGPAEAESINPITGHLKLL
jgi:peptidyl-tRNA hydrolase, PTH2 family